MCRTGRVFRPEVDGMQLTFVLVGANYRNAILEDEQTGSWWYQATGVARIGPLSGRILPEVPSEQMTLGEWLGLHPDSDVLQPDPSSDRGYHKFEFDQFDQKRPDPEDPEHAEGGRKEWVVGVSLGGASRAYPWSYLKSERLIQDELGGVPVALHLRSDGISFRAWDRRIGEDVLQLTLDTDQDVLVDTRTRSTFGFDGVAGDGPLRGKHLRRLRATQEFWHAFERFHPGTDRYEPP